MLLGVLVQTGVVRLIEQRQIDFRQVGDIDREAAVGHGLVPHPLADREAGAAGPGAGDDDQQARQGGFLGFRRLGWGQAWLLRSSVDWTG